MFNFDSEAARLNHIIRENAKTVLSDERIVELEIQRFKISQRRKEMFDGEKYFRGKHDILDRKRTVIGEKGELEEVKNCSNGF